MKILGIAGWSGAGKTTLVTKLIPVLSERGIRVSTIKHAHHMFDPDQPGKDSYKHREAGAAEVLVSSSRRWALIHEHRGESEPTLETLLTRLEPADLVLVEGWKHGNHPKLEVYRPAVGKPLLVQEDSSVIAVASDVPASAIQSISPDPLVVPVLDINDVEMVGDFIIAYCRDPALMSL